MKLPLVSGGAAGGAGNIDEEPKGYAYTFSGILDRNYVSENDVNKNVKNIKVSGTSVSASYAHGTATLKEELKYAANNQIYNTGRRRRRWRQRVCRYRRRRRYAYKRVVRPVSSGTDYSIAVGAGGRVIFAKEVILRKQVPLQQAVEVQVHFLEILQGAAAAEGGLWHFRKSENTKYEVGRQMEQKRGKAVHWAGTPLTSVCLYSDRLTTGKVLQEVPLAVQAAKWRQ